MNWFVIGTLTTGTVGIIGFAITSRPKPSRKPYALTANTATLLRIIGKLEKPSPPDPLSPKLALSDVLSLYFNSRDNRSWMNERRLEGKDRGASSLLVRLNANHARTKRLVAAWFVVQILDRLAPGCTTSHCRNLLWSYAEGQEILSQLGEYCSSYDMAQISARV